MLLFLWQNFPALYFGLSLLIGTALAMDWNLAYAIPLVSFWMCLFPLRDKKLKQKISLLSASLAVALLGFAYCKALNPQTEQHIEKKREGTGYLSIHSIQKQSSFFRPSLRLEGTLCSFDSGTERLHQIPCSLTLPLSVSYPDASVHYLVQGSLIKKENVRYLFKPKKGSPWIPQDKTYSLATERFASKERVKEYLHREIPHLPSYHFLSALLTGDVDEKTLSLEFARVGLQHILAISGAHFVWISLVLSFFLRLLFSPKLSAALLLLILSAYFLFLGSSPSIQRAWITTALLLLGQLSFLKTSGINALGIALIAALLCNPLVATHLGFQLTFLTTLAILLYFPLFNRALSSLLPPRPLNSLLSMNRLNQHGYILSAMTRSALALNLSCHLFTLPVLLLLFHQFPLISLIYNLLFPFWAALSLFLLILALLAIPIPFLSHAIHLCNSYFTAQLLKLTSYPPLCLNYSLTLNKLSLITTILLLTLLFWVALFIQKRALSSSFPP